MTDEQLDDELPPVPPPPKKGGGQLVNAPRATHFMMRPRDLTVIGLDTEDGPEHPLYDERINLPLDPDMVKNIRVRGVIETVRAVKDGDRVLVWSGRRRTVHAREADRLMEEAGEGKLLIPVLIEKGDQRDAFSRGLAANRFRVDDGVLASARQAKHALDMGGTTETVAADMAVSDQTIRNWVALLSAAPEVISAVERGELGATAALPLTGLSHDDQRKQLSDLKREAGEGVKLTAALTKAKVGRRGGRPGEAAARVTPKERVEKATAILTKTAALVPATKEVYLETLQKLARVLTGRSLEKLSQTEEG